VTAQRLRLAAYAVCVRNDLILLARYVSPDRTERHWTLPGGKVEHGEDPFDAVVREVAEETGYAVEVERLLGVDSRAHHVPWGGTAGTDLHRVAIVYGVRATAGELRSETSGTTDLAAWVPLADVPEMERTVMIDVALAMHRGRPAGGHIGPVPVGGLVRH
jgi:8-oxo-dGTP diphosphatase